MSERFTRRHLNVASRLRCETVGEFTPVLLRQVVIADQMRQIDVNNETLRLNGSLTALLKLQSDCPTSGPDQPPTYALQG